MPFRKTSLVTGHYYHVFNRGALRFSLFLGPALYDLFLQLATYYAQIYKIKLVAICLMPNHFHLIVSIDQDGNLPHFMRMLCGVFSRKVNKYHRRTGTIFEGRYHCKHVHDDAYFKQLCRYIHLNPVKAALVTDPADWPYSTFAECVGKRNKIQTAHTVINDLFGGSHNYSRFVQNEDDVALIKHLQFVNDLAEMHLL
ncbi:MAG: transposase [Ignavibacteria bacterium]|nr:transposase [Ignavibacteria bacterium]